MAAYYVKSEKDVIKGLDCCSKSENGCLFETDKDCPYRTGPTSCDWRNLLIDAKWRLEKKNKELDEAYKRLDNVRDAVCGPLDSENCSYECEVPAGDGYHPGRDDDEN